MKNEKKNKQIEAELAQPKGANELNDDVLEAATGGATLTIIHPGTRWAQGELCVTSEELYKLRRKFGPIQEYHINGKLMICSGDIDKMREYEKFLNGYSELRYHPSSDTNGILRL